VNYNPRRIFSVKPTIKLEGGAYYYSPRSPNPSERSFALDPIEALLSTGQS
jgi:hypothetical protein